MGMGNINLWIIYSNYNYENDNVTSTICSIISQIMGHQSILQKHYT